jgi:predicted enzyme related to lactoylglutathione lyase
MPEMTKYEPGTPCWIELSTTDLDSAKKFYGAVLGWNDYDVAGPEAGNYTMPKIKEKPVAGMMTQMDDEKAMGVPPHWNTYVRVKSADDTAKTAKELGATVVVEPMDVLDVGRMCVILDPEGAAICAWEPKAHPGAGIWREPGSFAWSELHTKDKDKAKSFYTALFGWGAQEHAEPMPYTEWQVGGESVGGMMQITPEMGPMPPNWLTYFEVADADDTVAKANKAGGNTLMGPHDIPDVGRFAVLADPQGAVFAVIKSEPH